MNSDKTERGFGRISHPTYPPQGEKRLVQESSAIRDYDDAMDRPGSSAL